MRRLLPAAFLLFAIPAAFAQQPSADDLAKRVVTNMAGPAWESARYLAFTFDVDRSGQRAASFAQRWDRFTGDYRVAGKDRQGHDFVVLMNVNTKQGKAWQDGAAVTDPKQLGDLMTLGYGRFINDTYWLLMPLKMLDPGVHRAYDGERSDSCGTTWDVIKLTFDNVGLTPGDTYWAWMNRDTGIVDRWVMKLQSYGPDDPVTEVRFHEFGRFGGLLLSQKREVVGKNQNIRLDDITVASAPPAGAFEH